MKQILILTLAMSSVLAAQQDKGKEKIERPVKKAVREDAGKKMVEFPVKESIRDDESRRSVEEAIRRALAPDKVDLAAAGIVWHKGIEAALHKGKPVLLFQLLGNFDDVYC